MLGCGRCRQVSIAIQAKELRVVKSKSDLKTIVVYDDQPKTSIISKGD